MYICVYIYIYIYGSISIIHGPNRPTIPPSDPQEPPRVHMRQQACLLCDAADMSALDTCKIGAKREVARLLVGGVDVDAAATLGSPLIDRWVTLVSIVGQPWVNLRHPGEL